jgi:hypothetical protein
MLEIVLDLLHRVIIVLKSCVRLENVVLRVRQVKLVHREHKEFREYRVNLANKVHKVYLVLLVPWVHAPIRIPFACKEFRDLPVPQVCLVPRVWLV